MYAGAFPKSNKDDEIMLYLLDNIFGRYRYRYIGIGTQDIAISHIGIGTQGLL